MKCFICEGKIINEKPLMLFRKNICRLCMHSIGEVDPESIFYDYYINRIKKMQSQKIKEII